MLGRIRKSGTDGRRYWSGSRNRRVEIKAIHGLPKTILATGAHVVRISDRNDRLWSRGGGAAGGPASATGNNLGR